MPKVWTASEEITADKLNKTGIIAHDCIVDAAGFGDYTNLSDAIAAGKLRIFVKTGTYNVSANITIPANAFIAGEDWQSVVINFANAQFLLNNPFITLRDLKFTGYKLFDAFLKGTGDDVKVERCQILQTPQNNNNDTVNLTGLRNSIVDSIIQLTNNCFMTGQYAVFARNRVTSIDKISNGNNCQIYLSGDDAMCIDNILKVTDSGAGYLGYGINLGGQRSIAKGNNVMKTDSISSGQFGIYAGGNGSDVSNNRITGFQTGIYLNADNRQTCVGNSLYNQRATGISVNGYTNQGYGYKTVVGNVVHSPAGDGIQVSVGAMCLISANAIYGAGGKGINLGTGASWRTIVTNNEVAYCTSHGIFADGGGSSNGLQNGIVCNNLVYGNSGEGIYIRVYSCTVIGNMCSSNSGTNFDVTNVGNSQIANNVTS